MKTKLNILIVLVLLTFTGKLSSQAAAADPDYVILQIKHPIRTRGETELIFYYGNNREELFKKVNYAIKYEPELPNAIASAINYMSKKGYALNSTT